MKKVKGLEWTHDPEIGNVIMYHGFVVGYVTAETFKPELRGWANGHGILVEGVDLQEVRAKLLDRVTEIAIQNGAEPGE